ncbi:MAG TPA: hypothetical protein VER03_01950 [Bryobacteraceae bacterium]|nr:hypothetical protein [Bryobacteraceae bacterium]
MAKSVRYLCVFACGLLLTAGETPEEVPQPNLQSGTKNRSAATVETRTRSNALDDLLASTPAHGISLDKANQALQSPGAVARLIGTLTTWKDRSQWSNTTLLLGLSGDERAYEALMEFLNRDDSPAAARSRCASTRSWCEPSSRKADSTALERDVYGAKMSVPVALGLLVYQIQQRNQPQSHEVVESAINELKSGSRAKYWKGRIAWAQPGMSPQERAALHTDLSARCIRGLGFTGSSQAKEHLEGLRDHLQRLIAKSAAAGAGETHSHPFVDGYLTSMLPSLVATAETAIARNAAIASGGLRAGYPPAPIQ